MSWKTTVCGLLALVGGLLPQFWPEYAKLGAFVAALSTGAMGLFARDNNKTSEDVGANMPKPSLGRLSLYLFVGMLSFCLFAPLAGCQSPPQRQAFAAVQAPTVTVQTALKAWDDWVSTHSVPVAQQIAVKNAYAKVQAAELVALDAAQTYANAAGNTNSFTAGLMAQATSQNVNTAISDLVNLIQSFGVKL